MCPENNDELDAAKNENGWQEWKRYVLETIKHIDAELMDQRTVLRQHCLNYEMRHERLVQDVASLKSKVVTYGAIAAAVITVAAPVMQDLFAKIIK